MGDELIGKVKDLLGIVELPLLVVPYEPLTERIAPEEVVLGTEFEERIAVMGFCFWQCVGGDIGLGLGPIVLLIVCGVRLCLNCLRFGGIGRCWRSDKYFGLMKWIAWFCVIDSELDCCVPVGVAIPFISH